MCLGTGTVSCRNPEGWAWLDALDFSAITPAAVERSATQRAVLQRLNRH
jgi:hypothetical protein